MKTICIKTNNQNAINYLLKILEDYNLESVKFSCKQFKSFKNLIIHYKGSNVQFFTLNISKILSSLIIDQYEQEISYNILSNNYFYFNTAEKKEILKKTDYKCNNNIEISYYKKKILLDIFANLLKKSNKIYLKGVITFRLSAYKKELQTQIDSAVNEFLIEREYNEFVSLLKLYINTEPSKTDFIHLIYKNGSPIILDKNKNLISTESNLLNAKFLSDISFSDCDIALNTLLNLIPQKICIHLIENQIDEFINTLIHIFENRIELCTNCNICHNFSFGDGPFL